MMGKSYLGTIIKGLEEYLKYLFDYDIIIFKI